LDFIQVRRVGALYESEWEDKMLRFRATKKQQQKTVTDNNKIMIKTEIELTSAAEVWLSVEEVDRKLY